MKIFPYLAFLLLSFFLSSCSTTKIRTLSRDDILQNEYVSFRPPLEESWYLLGDNEWLKYRRSDGIAQRTILNMSPKGATYEIQVQTWPFKWMSIDVLFDKNGDYEARRKYLDTSPKTLARNKEQGIGYSKRWEIYVNGLKCVANVYSRSHGGYMKAISSKIYSITCGYYDKVESKRILRIDYVYRHAGGPIRHQKDKNIPRDQLISLEQAEAGLKQAVKQLVATIRIKNFDRERMQKEGLLHPDKAFELSDY